jgi:hypothetical protein
MGRISKVRITPTPAELYAKHLKLFPPLNPGEKLGVNKRFWQMLAAVLKVAFPRCVNRLDTRCHSDVGPAKLGKRRSCCYCTRFSSFLGQF